jgi:Kelch motif
MRILKGCFLALIFSVGLFVAGCGGGSNPTSASTPPPTAPATPPPAPASTQGDWTWVGGSQQYDQVPTSTWPGVTELEGAYQSTPAAWTDMSGNFWLFGGGLDSTGTTGAINAMWRLAAPTATNTSLAWTVADGSITLGATACVSNSGSLGSLGSWGTQGQASATNAPSGRFQTARWTDASGNLWLFGGDGCDASGDTIYLNDLWKFNPSTGNWTWVSGGSTGTPGNDSTGLGDGNAGSYGTKGVAAAGNTPGARIAAATWTDAAGNLWLFGGYGCDSTDSCANYLDDLWKYNPTTGDWTWEAGADTNGSTQGSVDGVYGTKGTAAAGNTPGGRESAIGWTDAAGNLWLFSGAGYDSVGNTGSLSDMWEYSPTAGTWTWIAGSNLDSVPTAPVYGTKGQPAATNTPGAREDAAHCSDASGNLWLFGGDAGELNDLWEFSPSTGNWTWEAGGQVADMDGTTGSYGTLGVAAATNVPQSRQDSACWFDITGNLWIFGGGGYQLDTGHNDLWFYQVVAN